NISIYSICFHRFLWPRSCTLLLFAAGGGVPFAKCRFHWQCMIPILNVSQWVWVCQLYRIRLAYIILQSVIVTLARHWTVGQIIILFVLNYTFMLMVDRL